MHVFASLRVASALEMLANPCSDTENLEKRCFGAFFLRFHHSRARLSEPIIGRGTTGGAFVVPPARQLKVGSPVNNTQLVSDVFAAVLKHGRVDLAEVGTRYGLSFALRGVAEPTFESFCAEELTGISRP